MRAGDTVSAIAARYGTHRRRRARGQRPVRRAGLLQPGQRLTVAAAATAPAGGPGGAVLSARPGAGAPAWSRTTARRYGVDPSLALAVAYHESGFQQGVVSGVGAVGVMQVLPRTARALSAEIGRELDLQDPADNVTAGVLLLRQLQRSLGVGRARCSPATTRAWAPWRVRASRRRPRSTFGPSTALRPRFANG